MPGSNNDSGSASVNLVMPGQRTVACAQQYPPAAQMELTSLFEVVRACHPLSKNLADIPAAATEGAQM